MVTEVVVSETEGERDGFDSIRLRWWGMQKGGEKSLKIQRKHTTD